MALFKILKNNKRADGTTISSDSRTIVTGSNPPQYHEGWCYFDTTTNKFWIDIDNTTRVPLNAQNADIANYAAQALADTDGNILQDTYLAKSSISNWALASTKPSYNFSEIGSKPTTISGYGITDGITGSGTSGYIAKFNGARSITNGPQFGSSTTTFLSNDGQWRTPQGTYSLSTAGTNTLGGIKTGYTTDGNNRAVQVDENGNAYVVQKDNNTWQALTTSQPGYVAKAPNDTAKFLRGDATWAAVTKANVGLGNVTNESKATMFTSAALTGTPTAPTAAAGTNSTQIATTAFVTTALSGITGPMMFKGTLGTGGSITTLSAASANNKGYAYKVITAGTYQTVACDVGDLIISNGEAWVNIPAGDETVTNSATTGITASTTATKTTLGTAFTIPNVTSAGSASNWAFEEVSIPNVTSAGSASNWVFEEISIPNVTSAGSASNWVFEEVSIPNVTNAGSASTWTFEEKSIPNVTSAGSASTWTFEEKSIPNVTNAGSGSFGATVSNHVLSFSHAHTAPTLGTAIKVQSKSGGGNGSAPTLGTTIKVQSKSGGGNGSAPTLGTAIAVQSKKSGGNGTAPTLGTAIAVQSKKSGGNGTAPTLGTAIKVQSKKSGGNGTAPTLGTAFTVPNVTGNTSATVSITDNGHSHTI